MDYREKRDLVCQLFLAKKDDFGLLLDAISKCKLSSERADKLCRLLVKYIPYELAYYDNGDAYGSLHIFNGKYYEPLSYDNIKFGIEDFLYEVGVPAVDRTEKALYFYMARVKDRIKEHELHPRLSLMCFTNCVVDMNNLKKMHHGPEHDCVKMYGFKYDRREILNCTVWNKFIGESYIRGEDNDGVLPEKMKRRILQMFLGACLVDRRKMSFEYFMILQGTGANGKSVISRVLAGMFGDEELLNIKLSNLSRPGDEGLRAVESMRGKRILHSTESTKSDFKDLSVLKQVSSGEPLAGRALKSNIKMLQRPPLLMCNSNYRWKMSDFLNREDPDDTSVQRRAVIINFDKTIPIEDRDTQLSEKMKAEYSGIFAWIVKGLVELKKNNWKLPESVDGKVDVALMRIRSSVIGIDGKKVDGSVSEWLKLMTMHPMQDAVSSWDAKTRRCSELFENYERFCDRVGANAVSIRKFGNDLMSLGYVRERSYGSCYTFYVEDENISRKFDGYVPNVAEAVSKSLFEGFYYTEEDFINERDLSSDF